MKTSIGGGAAASNATLCDLLDRLIDTGVVARGSIVISVAGIELIYIEVSLLVASVETAFGERRTLTRPDAVAA
nr:gas vesicle protein [uncultured Rhodopila sp.]